MSKMEIISAQYALPTFHAVHKRGASSHPGFGVTGLTFDNHAKFDTTQVTFPQLFQKAGYQTAMYGKLHFGTVKNEFFPPPAGTFRPDEPRA